MRLNRDGWFFDITRANEGKGNTTRAWGGREEKSECSRAAFSSSKRFILNILPQIVQ